MTPALSPSMRRKCNLHLPFLFFSFLSLTTFPSLFFLFSIFFALSAPLRRFRFCRPRSSSCLFFCFDYLLSTCFALASPIFFFSLFVHLRFGSFCLLRGTRQYVCLGGRYPRGHLYMGIFFGGGGWHCFQFPSPALRVERYVGENSWGTGRYIRA